MSLVAHLDKVIAFQDCLLIASVLVNALAITVAIMAIKMARGRVS